MARIDLGPHPRGHLVIIVAPVVADQVQAAVSVGEDRSTYEIAAAALSVHRLAVEQTFEAISLDPVASGLLQMAEGSSALRVCSVFATHSGVPVEFRMATYPGERYSFRAHRTVEL